LDPTYVAPSLATVMIVDTRSGEQTWLHPEPVQASDFTWSPDGSRLAYFLYDGERFALRVYDANTAGSSRELALRTDRPIAASSPLVWSADGGALLLALRPRGWSERAREAYVALTEAPVIVQDSREDFLAWDALRNIADEQTTVLVSLADGSVRELLADVVPTDVGFAPDGSRITYGTAVRTKTSYTRRDGTEYGLYALDHGDGTVTELVEPSEDRLDATWNEARDAYAYPDSGAVFIGGLGDDEPRNATAGLRILQGDTTEVDFSVDRWSPDDSELLLTSSKGWHVLDADGGELRTVLALEEEEDARPRREPVRWSEDGRHLYFSYSAADRWQRGLKRLDL